MAKLASNPEKLAEYQFGLSCEKAIHGTAISLIRKTDKQSFDYIFGKLLVLCADSITVNNKFGLAQIPMYREAIFKKYYFLTIDEIAYVLKNGIMGAYKKEYNKLDLETLMTWFEIYDTSERMEWLDMRNHNEKIESIKQLEKTTAIVPKEVTDKIIKSLVGDSEEKESRYKIIKEKFIEDQKRRKFYRKIIMKKDKIWTRWQTRRKQ